MIHKPSKILLTLICSFICAVLISINTYFFVVILVILPLGCLALMRPLYFICSLLFISSSLDFFLPHYYFFSGPFLINLAGLRNILLILWCIIIISAHFHKLREAAFFRPISFYLFVLTISTIVNFSNANLRFYTHVLSPFLFYFVMIIFVNSKSDLRKVFAAILVSSIIPIVIALLQEIRLIPSLSEGFTYVNSLRIDSTFGHPNAFGVYLVLFAFYATFIFRQLRNKLQKALVLIYLVIVYVCIVLSQSRNALIGILVGIFIIAKIRTGLRKAIITTSLLIGIIIIIPNLNQRVIVPSTTFNTSLYDVALRLDYNKIDEYSMGRLSIWKNWLGKMSKATSVEYLFGFGESITDIQKYDDFHNSFLRTLIVNGVLVLIAFVNVILSILLRLSRWLSESYRKQGGNIYIICAFAYILSITVMANFGKVLGQWQILLYYFAMIAIAEKTHNLELHKDEKY